MRCKKQKFLHHANFIANKILYFIWFFIPSSALYLHYTTNCSTLTGWAETTMSGGKNKNWCVRNGCWWCYCISVMRANDERRAAQAKQNNTQNTYHCLISFSVTERVRKYYVQRDGREIPRERKYKNIRFYLDCYLLFVERNGDRATERGRTEWKIKLSKGSDE